MDVKRTGIILKPSNSRVVIRPFEVPSDNRIERILARVSSLSEQDVRVAEMHARASVEQANGESQAIARRAEGEAQAKRRIGEAEAEVAAIRGRNEGEAIRAVGDAKAEAYRKGVEAMGAHYGLLQIFSVLADRNIRLTPDVLVSGNGGSSEGLLAVVLRDLLERGEKKAS